MFQTLLESARRCNAIYIEDTTQMLNEFDNLNHEVISIYLNDDHKAVLSIDRNDTGSDFTTYLTLCGSRVSSGTMQEKFGDLYDDMDTTPLQIEPGILVPTGPWNGCEELYLWASDNCSKLFIEGHSLGSRSRYARYFLPSSSIERIISFGPPKFASPAFWNKYLLPGDITCIYRRDLWAGWPFELIGNSLWTQPPGQSILYIEDHNFARITEKDWAGGLDPLDHSIDGAYIPALENLAKVFGNGEGL